MEVDTLDRLSHDAIRATMQQLPIAFQLVLYYASAADRPYAEIAAIMNTPIGTVMLSDDTGHDDNYAPSPPTPVQYTTAAFPVTHPPDSKVCDGPVFAIGPWR